ncbi:hypothetical protein J6590_099371, partial [Homalodisca vitripennis]
MFDTVYLDSSVIIPEHKSRVRETQSVDSKQLFGFNLHADILNQRKFLNKLKVNPRRNQEFWQLLDLHFPVKFSTQSAC